MSATLQDQIFQDGVAGQFLIYGPEIASRPGNALSFKDWVITDIIEIRVSCHCLVPLIDQLGKPSPEAVRQFAEDQAEQQRNAAGLASAAVKTGLLTGMHSRRRLCRKASCILWASTEVSLKSAYCGS